MLDEKAVKEFFLEIHEDLAGNDSRPAKVPEIFHAKMLSGSRERGGAYLFYKHLWFEEENKGQNIVQRSGLIAVSTMKQTLWTMNYDGWYEGGEEIYALGNQLLIEALTTTESFGSHEIRGATKDERLLFEIEIHGRFQTFEIKTMIIPINQPHLPVLRFIYRGRALVNLSS